ncbi:hypothetical protein NPIL_462811 [Nephila pilipes]|uniref:Uncharacterized protein n=1 Tax=Nephila pilipes TaxID=299642 RepID=A0A8X6P209_NEPPI|nr:hypothetical protein NPIL_462811 [Nephila pilipes]
MNESRKRQFSSDPFGLLAREQDSTFRIRRSKISCSSIRPPRRKKIRKQRSKENCKRYRELLRVFVGGRFSAAGIRRIYDSVGKWRKAVWSVIVCVAFLTMCHMTYKVIKEYFEYKKIVEQTVV